MYTRNLPLVFALAFLCCFLIASAQVENFAWTKDGSSIVVSTPAGPNVQYKFGNANVLKNFLQQLTAFKTFTFDTGQANAWDDKTFKLADGSLIAISAVPAVPGATRSVQVTITPGIVPAFQVTKDMSITQGKPNTFHEEFKGRFDLEPFEDVVLMHKPLTDITKKPAPGHYRLYDGEKEYVISVTEDGATISMRPYSEHMMLKIGKGVVKPVLLSIGISLLAIWASKMAFMYFDEETYQYGLKTSAVIENIPLLSYFLSGREEDEGPELVDNIFAGEDDDKYSSIQSQNRRQGPGDLPMVGEKLSDVRDDAAMVLSLVTLLVPLLLL